MEAVGYRLHQARVFGRVGDGIGADTVGVVGCLFAFKLRDEASGDEFHIRLRGGEVQEGTSVEERRAGNTHVHLSRTRLFQAGGVVFELGAAHDGVVAEKHALVFEDRLVVNEFHLRHEVAHLLSGGCERAGPSGGVFRDSPLVGHSLSCRITHRHADTGVGYSAGAVHLCGVGLAHQVAAGIAHLLGIASLVVARRETVVHPQERANLHLLVGLSQHLHVVG